MYVLCGAELDRLFHCLSVAQGAPRDVQLDHELDDEQDATFCQMCQSALSEPRAKTSRRPSALAYTAGSLVSTFPKYCQSDQPELGAVCQMCQRALWMLSAPRAKTSRRAAAWAGSGGWGGRGVGLDCRCGAAAVGGVWLRWVWGG
ncbi:hypothetical protein V2H77_07215, partial [Photorhabdus sp. P32]|uniref:hypothetical protein n=1 Tax=Photorhabdus sp. P32 TaxID=3117549 RepID=UPI00311AE619